MLELLDGPDEPKIPFLDQIQHRHSATYVFLGNRNDQPQVCFSQRYLGGVPILNRSFPAMLKSSEIMAERLENERLLRPRLGTGLSQ
jgi:hypothetical protein